MMVVVEVISGSTYGRSIYPVKLEINTNDFLKSCLPDFAGRRK